MSLNKFAVFDTTLNVIRICIGNLGIYAQVRNNNVNFECICAIGEVNEYDLKVYSDAIWWTNCVDIVYRPPYMHNCTRLRLKVSHFENGQLQATQKLNRNFITDNTLITQQHQSIYRYSFNLGTKCIYHELFSFVHETHKLTIIPFNQSIVQSKRNTKNVIKVCKSTFAQLHLNVITCFVMFVGVN